MTAEPPLYVLDSFALLAFFQDEPAADAVQELLERGQRHEVALVMAVVNLGEVVYKTIRHAGEQRASEVVGLINDFAIQMIDVDRHLALAGAQIKGTHPVSYADCIAAALAGRLRGTLVTGDPEFQLVQSLIDIEWLPRAEQR